MKTVKIDVPCCELCESAAEGYGAKCEACGVQFCKAHALENIQTIMLGFEVHTRNTYQMQLEREHQPKNMAPLGFSVCKACFEKPEIQHVIAGYVAVDLKIQDAARRYAALPFSLYAVSAKAKAEEPK